MLQNLLRILPPTAGVLTVRLAGVDGFTGRGSIRYAANDRAFVMTVTLTGVAGRRAEVFANGRNVADVAITNGRANATFSSSRGDKVPALSDGARIEIRQNGDVVLDGDLARA